LTWASLERFILNKMVFTYGLAVLFPRLASFGVLFAGAHFLSQTELGYYSLIALIGEFTEATSSGWIRIGLLRFVNTGSPITKSTANYFGGFAFATTLIAIAFSIAVGLFLAPEEAQRVVIALMFYVLANSILRLGLTYLQILEMKFAYSCIEVTRAVLFFLATIIAMRTHNNFLIASLAGIGVTFCAGVTTLAIAISAMKVGPRISVNAAEMLRFGVPLIIVSMLGYVVSSLDKTLIVTQFNKSELGAYAVAFALGRQGLDVLANAVNISSFPKLVQIYGSGNLQQTGRKQAQALRTILALGLPSASVLFASRNFFAHWLFPTGYWQAIDLAIPLVIAGSIFLNLKNFVFDNTFHLFKKNILQIPSLAAGAAATLGSSVLLASLGVYVGASLMFASGALVSMFFSLILARGLLVFAIPWKDLLLSLFISFVAYWFVSLICNAPINQIVIFCYVIAIFIASFTLSAYISERELFSR
jgi:O-antigen/teichoic acid export membrane protein